VPPDLDIKELCDGAGVTPRTVHYYIQQGLLPSSGTTGSGARYSREHLDRLQLIRLLQNEHLPLAEINRRLRKLTGAEVRSLIDERRRVRDTPQGSALDYVRKVLNNAPVPSAAPLEPAIEPSSFGRSQWDRIDLADGLELNVRRPLTRQQQRQLDKLLAAAREIFAEP
jgi:DNA-binding transcriptional MerR regulator